ncbi:CopG family antitoxin [Bdellovibrionota bacterium FG-2]
MRKEYDFSKLKPASPKYLEKLKGSITMRLDWSVLNYFKELSAELGIPYQSLINFVLRDYAQHELKPTSNWDRLKKKGAHKIAHKITKKRAA